MLGIDLYLTDTANPSAESVMPSDKHNSTIYGNITSLISSLFTEHHLGLKQIFLPPTVAV